MLDQNRAVIGDPVPLILRRWLQPWRPCFTAPSWEHVLVLVMGAMLATDKRTVTSCLRVTGRAEAANFASYRQILNRARWSSRAVARHLLSIVVDRLVPDGPVVIGMDDIIERRWRRRISARGIYRPVRPPVADRGDVRRNSRSSRRRDTAPMDRQSYRSNHAGASRILQTHLSIGL
jgi:hypothetical protein